MQYPSGAQFEFSHIISLEHASPKLAAASKSGRSAMTTAISSLIAMWSIQQQSEGEGEGKVKKMFSLHL